MDAVGLIEYVPRRSDQNWCACGSIKQSRAAMCIGCWAAIGRPRVYKEPKVSNVPLREAFIQSGRTASDVARELGWWCSRGPTRPHQQALDTSRVKRTLGLISESSTTRRGRTYRTRRRLVDVEVAEQIAWAIGVGPWEVMPMDAAA